MSFILTAFNWLCTIVIYMLLGRAIMSWFVNPYSANPGSFSYKLYALITSLTEPIVRPARNLMNKFNTGRFDFSILIAMLFVMLARWIVNIIFKMLI